MCLNVSSCGSFRIICDNLVETALGSQRGGAATQEEQDKVCLNVNGFDMECDILG